MRRFQRHKLLPKKKIQFSRKPQNIPIETRNTIFPLSVFGSIFD